MQPLNLDSYDAISNIPFLTSKTDLWLKLST